jgi:radical SAM superfamily enzyme YgiQ (UPF0313 family)
VRVALIHPPTIAAISTFAQEAVPPLGLAYVAAAVRAAGHEVHVIDAVGLALDRHTLYPPIAHAVLTGLRFDEITVRIPDDPTVIGVSCMFSNAWCPTRDLLEAIRARCPRAFIVVGGEHATACASFILETCAAVDACVLGEGESTMVALLDAIERGDDLASVRGVAVRRDGAPPPGGRELVRTLRRPRVTDLAAIELPAWDLFPIEAYVAGRYNHGVVRGRTMPILASRGCPYQCTFCSSPTMWTLKWQARSPEDVIAEMKNYVARYAVNDFAFYDLTAIVRRDWIVAFCNQLIAERLGVTWQLPSGTRTEALDEEVCRLLYRAGCRNLNYAPESGSERVLARIKKRVKIPRMLESMRGAVRAGLDVKVNIILGFPGETLEDVFDTYRFIARVAAIGVEAVSIFPFCAYPGTELYDELAATSRARLEDAYFQSLVYTDLARLVSYHESFSASQLRLMVLAGNALFLAVQAGTHLRRSLDLARQVLRREQTSKFANAIEPMRRRREAWRRLSSENHATVSGSRRAARESTPDRRAY